MTPPKDVSIRIENVTLSTANIPKEGIDLKNLNESTRLALSIFDINNDGKLSSAEIDNAIVKMANADKTHTEQDFWDPDKTITTKKNGKLEDVELETLVFQNKKGVDNSYEIKNGAKALQRSLVAEQEIKNKGLQRTYNDNWLKDSEGNHYKYNEQTMSFEKVDNVEFVAEDGSYRTNVKNAKGQQVKSIYEDDVATRIYVLNKENKKYVNPVYAAKIAGLEKWGNGYKSPDNIYIWNYDKYTFDKTLVLMECSNDY